ncbi:hypothetical protein SCUCBS95973_002375 [Sporothrix curviconia]|uniref:Arylsulfotransferase n=1 Tax=Sporothrix curviconia TaxID=1260050 RepID=A0ABP0B6D5_9PEZI
MHSLHWKQQSIRPLYTTALSLPLSLLLLLGLLAGPATADAPYHTDLDSYQDGILGVEPNQTFSSAPLVVAPVYQINTFDAAKIDVSAESAYMFMAGRMPGLGWGPSIVSSRDLSLIWADQHYGGMAQATNTFLFQGERVLAVFVDDAVRIISQSYEELYVVHPVGNFSHWHPDSHEAMLTDDDTVLLIVCPNWAVDLTPVGGPAEGRFVANCLVQEIDPVTNDLLFEWTTLDYFTVADSVASYHDEGVWDFAHMNSIQKTPNGNFLISYRHLSAIVLVDGRTREVIWVMGGKRNQFADISPQKTNRKDASAAFGWQHNPRVTGINRFTFFDNYRLDNGYCWSGRCSRGLEIEYDPVAKTMWLLNEWPHPQKVISASRGSVQRTHTGNALIAWGQNPSFVEYTPTGDLAMDFQRGQILTIDHGIEDIVVYRVAKGVWEGRPPWGPNISYVAAAGTTKTIYVSWNGATEVDRYVLLSSASQSDLDGASKVVAQSPRNGFETKFAVVGYAVGRYARIAALDIHGAILGATPAVDTTTGALITLDYSVTNVFVSAGSTTLHDVPSSAAVSVPSGTHPTKPPAALKAALSGGQIAGIVVGSVVGGCLVLIGIAVGIVSWHRRRRAQMHRMPHAGTAAAANNSAQQQQQAGGAGDDDAAQRLLENANEYGLDSFAVRNSTDSDGTEVYEDR